MAKSSWLTVSPTSGFGNKTIQNIGTTHTGRLQRQTVVTGRAIGIATTKTYTVTQKAKAEFIMIGAESYSVAAVGGIVTISGTSNSPKLTVSVGNGGTLGTLQVNGSTATNGSAISGDPGATAQYNWSIQIQVGENLTAAQRNIAVTVTGSSSSISDTAQIVQAASVFEYTFNIAAGTASLPASGGNSAITAQLTTKRNGTVISTRAVTPTLSGSATGFSISGTTVTAANRGTTVGEARSITVTGKFTTSETGETLSDTAVVSQAANNRVIVYSKPNITDVSAADIPASGGSVSSASVSYSQSRHYYYDSGATEELSALTTGGTIDYGTAVSGSNLGTTVKERTIVGQLTFTVSMNGQISVEDSVAIYQAANKRTETGRTISLSVSTGDIPAGGGTKTVTRSGVINYSFTSGATSTGSFTPTLSINGTGFSLDGVTVTAADRGTTVGARRTCTITASYSGATSKSVEIGQQANSATYGAVTLNASNPATVAATGGTATISASASQTVSFTSGDSRPGSVSIAYAQKAAVSGFSLSGNKVTVTANNSTSARSYVVTVTATGEGSKSASKEVTVSQAAGARTYSAITLNVSYPTIPAKGGTVTPTVTYSQTWGWNGSTTGGGTITSGGTIAYSGTSVSTSNGAVTAGTKGTAVSGVTTVTTATVQVTLNGKTASKQVAVQQQANSATYGAVTISGGSVSDIPASGGSVSAMSGISASQTVSFTSESTRPGSVSISYSTKVEAGSLGTTVKNRASVGTLTATATGEGSKSATKSLTVYQAGNYVKSVDLTGFAIAYSKSVSAAGGTVSPSVTQGSVKFTFTSGSTSTSTPSSTYGSLASSITYSGSAANGFSAPNSSSGAMTVPGRGTTEGAARNSGTVTATKRVTWTHASSYSGGGTKTDSMTDTDYATQRANEKTTITYGTPSVTLAVADIPASGGSVSSGTVTYSQSRTQNYTSGSTAPMSALTSGGSISYSSAVSAPSLGTTVKERTAIGTLTATVSMNGKSGSDSATVYQQANERITGSISYGKWQVSVAANRYTTASSPCPASGGTCTISRSASRTRTQNYSYTSGETSTAALSNETATPTLSISGTGASLSGTTVTWASRGTTAGEVRQATVTATHSGVSATEIVYQQANVKTAGSISYGAWQVSVVANRYTTSTSPCPASGGTCTITRSATRTRTQNYSFTSGDTTQEALSNQSGTPTLSISGTGASLSGTTVTWANRGTTDGAARQATVTANMDDVTATEIVYQQANSHTDSYNEPVIDRPNASHNFPNTGGSWDSEISVSQTGTRTYTSGSTTPLTGSTSFTLSSTVRWLSFLGQRITAQKNVSTSSRSATVTVSASGSGDKTSSTTIAITQDAVPYLNVSPDSLSFEAAGGTKNITIDTNEGWLIS